MGKYYCLMAGLPDISLDDRKPPVLIEALREELEDILTRTDRKLADLFFLKFDNRNLIARLRRTDGGQDTRGRIPPEEFDALYRAFKEGEKLPKDSRIPPYFETFFNLRASEEENAGGEEIAWDDRLAALYYAYGMECGNRFIAEWFELNLNINNMLVAITCRKQGWERADYIVGDNDVARALRTSNARDFGLGGEADYLPELQRIAEETDLMARERKVDSIKWNWLEEYTFFKPFDMESVFAYLLKLEMIERWATLDRDAGERTFRQIVGAMKKGSGNALNEFKRNNER